MESNARLRRFRVLKHPKIHNIFVDDDWDAHNPDAPTVAEINAFTQALASSHYLDQAGEYDVHHASFTGSNQKSVVCAPLQPELGHARYSIGFRKKRLHI